MMNDNLHLESLTPPPVKTDAGDEYDFTNRIWQGIPGIEITPAGKLFATWYSGGKDEGANNYILLVSSRNGGETWSKPLVVIDPPGKVRAFDPVVWRDPRGRLWLFWSQSYGWWNGRGGVWCIRCDDPDAQTLSWSEPRRIANGVMMNKPLVRDNREWLLPTAVWRMLPSELPDTRCISACLPELKHECLSNVTVSTDQGKTFALRGGADVPHRAFDEHMIVERRDDTLWMLVRTHYGIGQSTSNDGGATWTPGMPTDIASPCTRFFIRRLPSGRLLLINHYRFTGRSHLTASLSEDDGKTWFGHLLLDERPHVSYPDAALAQDGRIHVIYDRERIRKGEILMAVVTENDILAGQLCDQDSYLKRIISKAMPQSRGM